MRRLLILLLALTSLTHPLAAQGPNFTQIALNCPGSTQASITRVDATYYQQGSLACGSVTLTAVISGNTTYSSTTACNNGLGHYAFTDVTTNVTGTYTLTATTSDANTTCTLARVTARSTPFPEVPLWLVLPLSLAALGFLRRRRVRR